ncbi:hypothetical protein Tco_1061087 [Tanacetum coccineum]
MVVVPKLVGERFFRCTIRIECEWEPPRCLSCKVLCQNECLKKIISDVLKKLKNPRQAVRGVQVGPKLGFKPTKQVYQLVDKKNGANVIGKKKNLKLAEKGANNMVSSSHEPHVHPVNADTDNEAEEVFNEITSFMASASSTVNKSDTDVGNKSFMNNGETYNEKPYDDDDYDIDLCCQLK